MKRKIAIIVVLAVVLVGGAIGGLYYYNNVSNYITTDDATVQGDLMAIGSMVPGKLQSWNVKTGEHINEGEVLGIIETANLRPDGTAVTVDIKAQKSGTIIENDGKVGQIVGAGIPLAMSTDLGSLYVTANIKETNVNDVKLGQYVSIHVDAFPNTSFSGKVVRIGLATSSTFSLLPSSNTSGNYTKVTQRIPVKISIDGYHGQRLIPGLNATAKISK